MTLDGDAIRDIPHLLSLTVDSTTRQAQTVRSYRYREPNQRLLGRG